MAPALPSVDASLLRRALRLVHCLQKERGASCAFCASHDSEHFSAAMTEARKNTNVAMFRVFSSTPPALEKIRHQLDDSDSRQVHRILVFFNTLISNVVHTYILQIIARYQSKQDMSKKIRHKRASSDNADLASYLQSMHIGGNGQRCQSDNLMPEFLLSHAPTQKAKPPRLPSGGGFMKPSSDPYAWQAPSHDYEQPPGCLPSYYSPPSLKSPKSPLPKSPRPQKIVTFVSAPQDRIASLLSLLGCLVQLKESSGMERAVLSSVLCLSDVNPRLLTDLVLEVENQRKLVAALQELPEFDSSLQKLVQDGVVMGPKMEMLQTKILSDFDLHGFQQEMGTSDVWNLITMYIDKLHSLELLLVEEMEYCTESSHENGLSKVLHEDPLYGYDIRNLFGDARQVQETSPDEIKAKLLNWMAQNKVPLAQPIPPPPPPLQDVKMGLVPNAVEPVTVQTSKEWEINLYELQFQKRIGRGTAGTTYLANWNGQAVAVKVAAITEMGLDGWRTEVQSLQRLHHPNIIRLLGSVYNSSPLTYCLVLEYCNSGDLATALCKPTPANFFFKVSMDIANGMAYLHSRGVIHRDIKPGNVLLDGDGVSGNFTAKVSDFGVATTFDEEENRTAETGTYRWMAPEVIRHESYSIMADVYSFAILCWQLLTHEDPFENVSPLEAAGMVALELARPPFPDGTPTGVQAVIWTCWNENPTARMPFEQVLTKLRQLEPSLSEDERKWLQSSMGHPVYQYRRRVPEVKKVQLQPIGDAKSTPQLELKHGDRRGSGLRSIFARKKGHY